MKFLTLNEIFTETVGSTIAGSVAGVGLTILLASNPVGWGVALVLGSAAAITSYGAGKAARYGYNKFGQKTDLIGITGVDQLCK